MLFALFAPILIYVYAASVYPPTPNSVRFQGQQLYVDDKPFYIKGLCYSPVPVGESPQFPPFGDYFVSEYAYMWKRDLPLIKEMGVNTIRIYGWDTTHDVTHFEFLDEVHKQGLKILLTFYVGTKYENPPVFINSLDLKQVPITNFTREAAIYGDHPAILFWSFGNELNGPWNGFLEQISEIYSCGWVAYNQCWNADMLDSACMLSNECLYKNFFGWINDATVQVRTATTRPVISGMADVDRITDKNSKMNVSKLQLYGQYAPDLSAWSFQLYRGAKFGNYFKYFRNNLAEHPKPLIVTEYGTDAYNDPCGWPQNNAMTTCRNLVGDAEGGVARLSNGSFIGCRDANLDCVKPGQEVQAEWDVALTQEIYANRVGQGGGVTSPTPVSTCTGPWVGYPDCAPKMQWLLENWQKDPSYAAAGINGSPCSVQKFLNDEGLYCPDPYSATGAGEGVTLGGFMMAWMDEFWKGNIITEGHCAKPCDPTNLTACYAHTKDYETGRAAGCTWKAHWDCPNKNPYYHGLCGYKLDGAPDFYVNEEWFGLTMPEPCGNFVPTEFAVGQGNPQKYGLDTVTVRQTMKAMQKVWAPEKYALKKPFTPLSCSMLLPCWQCIQDHLSETAAFLHSCSVVCDISPLYPTPAPPPSTFAPTLFPSFSPSTSSPSPNATNAPTPAWKKTEVTIKFVNISFYEHEDLIVELSTFFSVPPARFQILKQRLASSSLNSNNNNNSDSTNNITLLSEDQTRYFIDLVIVDGIPLSFDDIFQQLVNEFEFLKLDPERGCTLGPQNCKTYTGNFVGPLLDRIDPQYPPTIDGNIQTPTGPPSSTSAAPTPLTFSTKRLSLQLASRNLTILSNFKTEFETQLALFFGVNRTRIEYRQMHQLSQAVHAVLVEFLVVEGVPSISALYQRLVSELALMKNSSLYGCSTNCTSYKSALAEGSVMQFVNPYFTPVLDAPFFVPPPTEEEGSNATGFVIAGCVVLTIVFFVMFVLWRRHVKAKKFADNQLLSYENNEPAYMAHSVN